MTSSHQTTIVEEGHATDFRVFRRLHLRDDLQLLKIPQQDGIVKTARNDLGCVWDLLFGCSDHFLRLKHHNLQYGVNVAFHVVSLDSLLDSKRSDVVVSHDQNVASIGHYLYAVDLGFDKLFLKEALLIIHIDDKYMALLICDIQFLILVVPTHVREDGLVWIFDARWLLSVNVGGFVPAQGLVRRYGKDQIL